MYWFLDDQNVVLYVGKAKNLKRRLQQYTQLTRLSPKIEAMVRTAIKVKWQKLESDLEALLIEAELIRLHQPTYNTLLKDDKTPLYIWITAERFPRVQTLRKKEIELLTHPGTILGPFPSGYQVKEVLKIARAIFPWCNATGNELHTYQDRPCFYYHLQLCPGACVGRIDKATYQQQVKQLVLFLRGKKKTVLIQLKQQLKSAARDQHYELAAEIRDKIQLIEVVTAKKYSLHPTLVLPNLTNTLREQGLLELRKLLTLYQHLPKTIPMSRIEGYDVSNTSGKLASVSMVTFVNGQPAPEKYKLFNIKTIDTPNDYQMIQEALLRRQNHPEWGRPDLVVIDGGKGQLRSALQVWRWHTPVISIAKDPDRIIIPTPIERQDDQKRPDSQKPRLSYHLITLPEHHPTLTLIQHIRNESHRFSKKQHTRRRLKNLFQ